MTYKLLLKIFLGILPVIGLIFASATSAYAQEASNNLVSQISKEQNLQLWEFSRSLVNYALVGMLILSAFGTLTRFGGESYSIKKILPNLIIGFFLANFSLFICRIILELADSLTLTTTGIFTSATGSTSFAEVMFPDFIEGVVGVLITTGVISTLVGSTGVGFIFAVIGAILLIFFPAIVMTALLAMVIVRFYVVQYLVAFSPIAFIALATPFTQKWFQAWWKQLGLWVFMKPIGYAFLSLGAIVISSNLGGTLVSYIVGLLAMVAAITIPFKAGGIINSTLLKLTKQGAEASRVGIASYGQKNEGKSGWRGALGQGASRISSVLYSGEVFQAAREKRKEKAESTAKIGAARLIGEQRMAERYEDTLTAESRKEFDEKTMGQTLNDILGPKEKAFNRFQKRAALQSLYQKGYPPMVWMIADGMIKDAEKRNDKAEAARLRKLLALKPGEYVGTDVQKRSLAIANLVGEKPKEVKRNGKSEYELNPGLATRTRQELSSAAAGKNLYAEAIALEQNYATGKFKILNNQEAEENIVKFIGSDPQLQANKANTDTWLKEEIGLNGKTITRLRDGIVKAFGNGLIDHSMTIDQNSRFDRNVAAELRKPEVWAAVTDQLKEAQKTMGQAERIETDIFMEVFGPNAKDPKSEDVRKLLKDLPGGKKEEAGTKSPTSHSEASADTSSFGTPSSST